MKKIFSAAVAAIILIVSVFFLNAFAADTTKTEALLAKLNSAKEVSVTLTAGDVNLLGAIPTKATDTLYIKDNKAAYEYKAGFINARAVIKDGAAYGFFPSLPFFYVKTENSAIASMDIWGLIEETTNITLGVLQFVKSYDEAIDGKTYFVEEFNDRAQVTSKFYYEGDNLKILKVEDAQSKSVQYTYFENISFTVDDSVFEIPAAAFDLTPVLKGLFLALIAA